MPDPADLIRQLDALGTLALRIASSTAGGRVAMAKLADQLDPAWLPGPWTETVWPKLTAAREGSREPVPFRAIEEALRSAWGGKPADELDGLQREPVAVTATSQVHRAQRDGRPVAVKVLRPGLAGAVRQDLTLLDALAAPLGSLLPRINAAALLREARERVMDEFDLEHEAATQRRFQRALRGHPFLVVPAPLTDLAREQVLVSEWIDGTPLSAGPPSDPDLIAQWLAVFVLGGLKDGMVHADLDPEDILVTRDGRLAVLDYGAVASPQPARVASALKVVEGFRVGDEAALGVGLGELGALDPALAGVALGLARHVLGPLGEEPPARLDGDSLAAVLSRVEDRPDDVAALLPGAVLDPADLWPARAVGQLFSVIARLGADAAWPELVGRSLADGWRATG